MTTENTKQYKKILTTERSGYYIECISVDERYHNQGIATKLLDYFIKSKSHDGSAKFYLDVDAKNTSAIRIYNKPGFSVTDTKRLNKQKSTHSMCTK